MKFLLVDKYYVQRSYFSIPTGYLIHLTSGHALKCFPRKMIMKSHNPGQGSLVCNFTNEFQPMFSIPKTNRFDIGIINHEAFFWIANIFSLFGSESWWHKTLLI
jgi:hypothetical protein